MGLIYTGGGFGGFLLGFPCRNLTDAEVEQLGGEAKVLTTGLYQRASAPIQKQKARGQIDLNDGVSTDEATLAGQTLAERKQAGGRT